MKEINKLTESQKALVLGSMESGKTSTITRVVNSLSIDQSEKDSILDAAISQLCNNETKSKMMKSSTL
tara:strand:+ start:370 stop:573 length:204 start_codon:yes stop_codon:yes gene_type:complete